MQHPSRPRNGRDNGPHKADMLVAGHSPAAEPSRAPASRSNNADTSPNGNGAHAPHRANGTTGPAANGVAQTYAKIPVPVPVPISALEAEQVARTQQADRARISPAAVVAPTPGAAVPTAPLDIPSLPPVPRSPARLTPVVLVLLEIVLDITSIAGGFTLAFVLYFSGGDQVASAPDVSNYTRMLVVTVTTIIITFYFSKLYSLKRGASRVDEFYKIAASVSMGTVLSLASSSLMLGDVFNYSRQVLLTGWLLTILFVASMRILYSIVLGALRKRGLDRSRVLIVGAGPTAQMVEERLRHHRTLGYTVVGMVESTNSERPLNSRSRVPILGNLPKLPELVRKHNADEVIIALSGASDKQLRDIMTLLRDESVSVKIYPDAFQLMTQNEVSVGELSGLPLLSIKDVALRGWNRRFKRAFDVAFSLFALILTAPLMLLIALIIKITSTGPVFFIQERVGLDGRPFQLVKFRTMKIALEGEETTNPQEGMPNWTVRNDPRRTRLGTFLRRFSLDELPQFYNVLVGEMSVVGPRPEQPAYVQEFARRWGDAYLMRHREKAGLTGWAQVNGLRGDSSIEQRTAADIYYVEHWSVLFDLKIIVRTVLAMFRGKNAY